MKTVLTFAALLGSFALAQAQFTGGSVSVGGQLGYTRTAFDTKGSTGTTPSNSTFSIIPTVNYFLSSKWSVGLGIGYQQTTNKFYNGTTLQTDKDGAFIINPNATWYAGIGEKSYFTLRPNASLVLGSSKTSLDGSSTSITSNSTLWGVGVAPGFLFFPADKLGVELGLGNLLGFSQQTTKGSDTSVNTFHFLDLSSAGVNVSVYYFIR